MARQEQKHDALVFYAVAHMPEELRELDYNISWVYEWPKLARLLPSIPELMIKRILNNSRRSPNRSQAYEQLTFLLARKETTTSVLSSDLLALTSSFLSSGFCPCTCLDCGTLCSLCNARVCAQLVSYSCSKCFKTRCSSCSINTQFRPWVQSKYHVMRTAECVQCGNATCRCSARSCDACGLWFCFKCDCVIEITHLCRSCVYPSMLRPRISLDYRTWANATMTDFELVTLAPVFPSRVRVRVLSDLHLEFYKNRAAKLWHVLCNKLPYFTTQDSRSMDEVMCLCGDIGWPLSQSGRSVNPEYRKLLQLFKQRWPRTILVAGNVN